MRNGLSVSEVARWKHRVWTAYAMRSHLFAIFLADEDLDGIAMSAKDVVVGLADFTGLVQVGVGAGYEHSRMADGENVYFITDDFVHDAVGFDNQLAKKSMACLDLFEITHYDSVCCFKEVG